MFLYIVIDKFWLASFASMVFEFFRTVNYFLFRKIDVHFIVDFNLGFESSNSRKGITTKTILLIFYGSDFFDLFPVHFGREILECFLIVFLFQVSNVSLRAFFLYWKRAAQVLRLKFFIGQYSKLIERHFIFLLSFIVF